MTPTYKYLLDNNKYGLDILVYSGDDDSVCGTIGTQGWIWDLGYTYDKKDYWTTWKTEGQTSGYLTKFNNARLAFATVHGAGHEVPTYKPAAALAMFQSYIKGELINN
jgi:carboxypeptidase C (cathepsin A)